MSNEKITKQGKLDLEKRLRELKEIERPRVMEDLNLARSQGDLSENADYDAARDKLQSIDMEMQRIQDTLDHAILVEEVKGGKVAQLGGAMIHTTNIQTGAKYSFVIVGSAEAKPSEGKISNTCPVALAVLGKTEGTTVVVEVKKPYELRIDRIGD